MIKEFFNPPSVSHLRLVNNNVMVGLVHKLAIRLTSEQSPIITFIAAVSGEGTSTIADMFAAALAEGRSAKFNIRSTLITVVIYSAVAAILIKMKVIGPF